MAETVAAPAPRQNRWLRWLLIVVGGLLLLVVILYFVLTSGGFFKGFILPRAGKAMNADITVTDASISPFSQVVLRGLKVQTTGKDPLLTAQEVRLRYSLRSILGGNYLVHEVRLASPVVNLVENPDGTSNLDPILKATSEPEERAAKPEEKGEPMKVDLRSLAITDGIIRQIKLHPNGQRDLLELSPVNLTVSGIKNGQTGKLELSSNLNLDQNPPAPGTNAQLQGKLGGAFDLGVGQDLSPASAKGSARLEIQKAGGAMAELAGLQAVLDCDATPTEVKQLALRFLKQNAQLGQLLVSGPFSLEKTEGKLQVQLRAIDREVLNLAGAPMGIDFGPTRIDSTNQVELARGGNDISVAGLLNVAKLTLARTNQVTPPVDLTTEYNLSVDRTRELALIRQLNLNGTQKQQPLISGRLTQPMSISWGGTNQNVPDSDLLLVLTNFNLADWKAFTGDMASAGTVQGTFKLASRDSGKRLEFDVASQIQNLTAQFGSNKVDRADAVLLARGQAAELKQVRLAEYRFELAQAQQRVMSANGAGTYALDTQDADLDLVFEAALPGLLALAPQADMQAASGGLSAKAKITQKKNVQNVTGAAALSDFTGQYGEYKFTNFGVSTDLDIQNSPAQLNIRKLTGQLRAGNQPAGRFDVQGTVGGSNQAGQVDVKLAELNEHALGPFLAPSLAPKILLSANLGATTAVRFTAQGETSVKTEAQLANLRVKDPATPAPSAPLEAKLNLDASMQKQVLTLRQCLLALAPTPRARNAVDLKGKVDMSITNVTQGALQLTSEALDVTPWYDLFSSTPTNATAAASTAQTPATTPAPGASAPPPPSEPAPMNLPFKDFTIDASIGHLYLRELDLADLKANLKLDGSRVLIKPIHFAMNGGPMEGAVDLDLGIPGWKYDLSFKGDKVPLAPLANSFAPDYRGQAKGDLAMMLQVRGQGTTGTNLQKNLAAQFGFTVTNANIQLSGPKAKRMINVLATGLRLPELRESPLSWLNTQITIGEGRINLENFRAVGEAFTANSQGVIPMAPALTNSPLPNLPVNVAIRRTLMERARLVPGDTPTNAAYVQLPALYRVGGTIGVPDPKFDAVAFGVFAARVASGLSGLEGTDAGKALQGFSDLLGGRRPRDTNTANIVPPSAGKTNEPARGLGGLLDVLGGSRATNAPGTNQPPATNAPVNPLDLFRRPRK